MEVAEKDLRWWILLTVIIGTFLGRLDQTVVNLALPKIINDFSITVSQGSWIATAYILANAVFVPIWGKLGDTIGRKKVYLMGFSIFIVGSVLAGLSWDLGSMIVFRIIQAIASSADYPTAMAIIVITFKEGKERMEALGIWSSAFAASAVLGPLVGGPLMDNFGWRSVFLINLPVGILGMAMAMMFVKESKSEVPTIHFDWWGAIALGVALSSLVLVLDQGPSWGWLSENSILTYIVCAVFTYIFYRIDLHHPEPIVDFKFFRNSIFVNTLANNVLVFMVMMGSLFLVPVFAQNFLGYNATQTGLLFIPMAFGLVIAAPLGASFVGKVDAKYIIAVSTLVGAIGMYLFVRIDPRATAVDLMVPLLVMAIGMGFGMPQRTGLIASAVPQEEIGVASSILALVRNISGAFGIAFFATILTNAIETGVLATAQNSIINTANPLILQEVTALIELKAQVVAYREVFVIAAAILVVGAVISLFMEVQDMGKETGNSEIFVES